MYVPPPPSEPSTTEGNVVVVGGCLEVISMVITAKEETTFEKSLTRSTWRLRATDRGDLWTSSPDRFLCINMAMEIDGILRIPHTRTNLRDDLSIASSADRELKSAGNSELSGYRIFRVGDDTIAQELLRLFKANVMSFF